jgi:glucose/arabinose dehydrogenase
MILLSLSAAARSNITGMTRVASGLSAPIYATHAPGDPSRLFIVERGGTIKILNLTTGVVEPTPFLTVSGVDTQGEGGLLGMAFHPDYSTPGQPGTGKFYLHYTTTSAPLTSRIRQYTVSGNANIANTSFTEVLSVAKPQNNHQGGWIGFSPIDRFLYVGFGDGGGSDDNDTGHTAGTGNAQDITDNLLGKMLRIDVNSDAFPADATKNYAIPPTNPFAGATTGDDEIFHYGLRNPFRASFDRANGNLWIGDVGQSAREEIDRSLAGVGGANFGWRLREGLIATPSGGVGGPAPAGAVDPVYDYDRDADQFGGTVVTGGYVYRGPDPDLQGEYFFLDSRNSATATDDNYWFFDPANPFGTVTNIDSLLTPNVGSPQFPVSFGEDAAGNLYIAYLISGDVYRLNAIPEPAGALLLLGAVPALLARRRRIRSF